MIRRPPRSTLSSSSAASDVYKRQGLFELDDDPGEGVLFLAASGQPHVVRGQVSAGAGQEPGAPVLDELLGAQLLGGQFGQGGRVGGELLAGQARVALVAALPGWQQAPAVGQDPVGALVQFEPVIQVPQVDLEVAGICGDLAVAQEL